MAKRGGKKGGGLMELSVLELHAELARRQRTVSALRKRRDRLAEKLAALDAELSAMGGGRLASGTGFRKRPKNDSNLVDALHALLDGKTMSVTEAAEEVQKAGYKTTSPSFRTIVNQTLINSGRFKRVSRGQYTSKKGG